VLLKIFVAAGRTHASIASIAHRGTAARLLQRARNGRMVAWCACNPPHATLVDTCDDVVTAVAVGFCRVLHTASGVGEQHSRLGDDDNDDDDGAADNDDGDDGSGGGTSYEY
jgi:hypothetical protein